MAFKHSSRYFLLFLAVAIIFSYAYYEARGYIHGPQLTITTPSDGFSVTQEELVVEGDAQNITSITLNGRVIFVDEAGHFRENVLLSSGYTVVTLAVEDRYGRTNVQYLRGMYTPSSGDSFVPETPVGTTTRSLKEIDEEDFDEVTSTSTPPEDAGTATLTPVTTL